MNHVERPRDYRVAGRTADDGLVVVGGRVVAGRIVVAGSVVDSNPVTLGGVASGAVVDDVVAKTTHWRGIPNVHSSNVIVNCSPSASFAVGETVKVVVADTGPGT